MAGPLLADAREHAAGCPAQEGRTDQHVDHVAAGAFVETPETGRLSDRQPQSGHFKELCANSANEFVHDVTFDDLGEQNAVHAEGAGRPLAKSRVTPCFWRISRMVGLGDLASSRQFGMANSAVERKCLQASASALNAGIAGSV